MALESYYILALFRLAAQINLLLWKGQINEEKQLSLHHYLL
jgi:hypothetical protein